MLSCQDLEGARESKSGVHVAAQHGRKQAYQGRTFILFRRSARNRLLIWRGIRPCRNPNVHCIGSGCLRTLLRLSIWGRHTGPQGAARYGDQPRLCAALSVSASGRSALLHWSRGKHPVRDKSSQSSLRKQSPCTVTEEHRYQHFGAVGDVLHWSPVSQHTAWDAARTSLHPCPMCLVHHSTCSLCHWLQHSATVQKHWDGHELSPPNLHHWSACEVFL